MKQFVFMITRDGPINGILIILSGGYVAEFDVIHIFVSSVLPAIEYVTSDPLN